jgi:pimeloyl-ACP methyl ester carboxylesterase
MTSRILRGALLLTLSCGRSSREDERPVLVLGECTLQGVPEPAQCGSLSVFENRDRKAGRMIPLRVAVLPARDSTARVDPLFIIVGGPGQSAVENAAGYARLFDSLRRERSLVFVDQRGTGASNPLPCDLYGGQPAGTLADFMPLDAVRSCRAALELRADLRYYTSELAADDLEDVRRALGLDAINLEAASYGTRVALVYLRRHPSHLRTVVLRSVTPPRSKQLLQLAGDAQAAFDTLAAACAAEARCHSAFPLFREELQQVLARLGSQPVRIAMPADSGGPPSPAVLARGPFAEKVRLILYAPETARFLPLLIHLAAQGDFGPFVELAADMGQQIVRQLSLGMYLSVTCAEDIAPISSAEAAQVPPNTFLRNYRVEQQRAACDSWPIGTVSKEFADPVRGDVPVLLISSSLDPITPPSRAAEVARNLANSRQIVVPNAGHSPANRCVIGIEEAFIRSGTHADLDLRCLDGIRRPPFALELPP